MGITGDVSGNHIVDYEKYCKTCKYCKLTIDENAEMPEPCNECLTFPVNQESNRPINWTENDDNNDTK